MEKESYYGDSLGLQYGGNLELLLSVHLGAFFVGCEINFGL